MKSTILLCATFLYLASTCTAFGDYNPISCFASGLSLYPNGFTASFEAPKFMDNDVFCTGCTIREGRNLPSLSIVQAGREPGQQYSFTLLESDSSPCPCDAKYFWDTLWPDYRQYAEFVSLTCFEGLVCGATLNFDRNGELVQTFEPFLSDTDPIQAVYPNNGLLSQLFSDAYAEPTLTSRDIPKLLTEYSSQRIEPKLTKYVLKQGDAATYTWSFGCAAEVENRNLRWLELKQQSYLECLTTATRRVYESDKYPARSCTTRSDCYVADNFNGFLNDVARFETEITSIAAAGGLDATQFASNQYWLYSANCYTDQNTCVTTLTVLPEVDVQESDPRTGSDNSDACYALTSKTVTADFVPMIQSSVDVTIENSRISIPFLPNIAAYNPCKFSNRFGSSEDYPIEFFWNTKFDYVETCASNLEIELQRDYSSATINTLWGTESPPIGPAPSVDCYVSVICASEYKINNFESPITLVFTRK